MGVSVMLSQSGKACSPHTEAAGLVRKSDLVGPGQVQVQRWNSIEVFFCFVLFLNMGKVVIFSMLVYPKRGKKTTVREIEK